MSAKWVRETQSRIYTLLEYRTKKEIGEKYSTLRFTKEEESSTPVNVFPSVFIKFLGGNEKANSLKCDNVNAFTCTIQIDVSTNKTQGLSSAEEVIWAVVDNAKKLGFQLFFSPEPLSTGNDTKRIVARMRRVIGYNDKLN